VQLGHLDKPQQRTQRRAQVVRSTVDKAIEFCIRLLKLVVLVKKRFLRVMMQIHQEIHDRDAANQGDEEVDRVTELEILARIDALLNEAEIHPVGDQEEGNRQYDETKCEYPVLEAQQRKGHEAANGEQHKH